MKKIYDDPIAHFKSIAKERNLSVLPPERKIKVAINLRLADNASFRNNLGYAIPKRIYSLLGINTFLQNKQKRLNIEYRCHKLLL
ncbi:hypothetical protein SDC9_48351 [bioreactor metagenome]|uniref:Uncharacterized protein n=1 Tax=bioreactor metagenome TaxID=1076179 RepID=A0A644WE25_9ZZZZ